MLVRSLSASLTGTGGGLQRYANCPCQYKTSRVNAFALYSDDKMMYTYDHTQIPVLGILLMFYCQLSYVVPTVVDVFATNTRSTIDGT